MSQFLHNNRTDDYYFNLMYDDQNNNSIHDQTNNNNNLFINNNEININITNNINNNRNININNNYKNDINNIMNFENEVNMEIDQENEIKPLFDIEVEVKENSDFVEVKFLAETQNNHFYFEFIKKHSSRLIKVTFQLKNNFSKYKDFMAYQEELKILKRKNNNNLLSAMNNFNSENKFIYWQFQEDKKIFKRIKKFPIIFKDDLIEDNFKVDLSYVDEYHKEEFFIITQNQLIKMKKLNQIVLYEGEYVINFPRNMYSKLQIILSDSPRHIDQFNCFSCYDGKFLSNWTKSFTNNIENN